LAVGGYLYVKTYGPETSDQDLLWKLRGLRTFVRNLIGAQTGSVRKLATASSTGSLFPLPPEVGQELLRSALRRVPAQQNPSDRMGMARDAFKAAFDVLQRQRSRHVFA
jgi:hypothetical protein